MQHLGTVLDRPTDVEEVEGGWLVACRGPHTVDFLSGGGGVGGGLGKQADSAILDEELLVGPGNV